MATEPLIYTHLPPEPTAVRRPKLYEVVKGEVVEKPPMGALESALASLLQDWMGPFARANNLGRVVTEMLFLLRREPELKRRPDLAFVSAQRWPLRRRVPRTEAWDVVPDLAVEVISQTNTADQVNEKIEDYFASDVRQVWVVYPGTNKVYIYDSTTSVRILPLGEEIEGGALLPGFRLPLAVLFQEEAED